MTRRAPSSRLCLGLVAAMRSEQVEAAQGEMLHRGGDEPLVASELNEAATAAALPRCRASFGRMLLQRLAMSLAHDADQSACACPTPGIEEAVSRYLAARENVRDVIGDGPV